MRFAFFGSSLVSAYWNGAATYYRGLLRALAARGHEVAFFEPDAFEAFVSQIAEGEMSNKPSEAQKRLQKVAQRAMRLNKKTIAADMVAELSPDSF